MRMSKHLDLNSRYSFPSELRIVRFDGHILVIAPQCLTWVVLENERQLLFFQLLQSNTIADAVELAGVGIDDVRHTLTQIEARRLSGHPEAREDASDNNAHMQLFLTNGCNLRCPHCMMFATIKGDDELSTEEVFAILDAFKSNGGRTVSFSGGEIAIRADLPSIIDYCRTIGLRAELLTNGTLWSESLVGKVASCLDRVQVSIDGYSEKSNARIRGAGNFEKALHAVDLFVRSGVKVEVAVTPMLTETLESEIPMYVDFAKNLKEKYKGKDFSFRFSCELFDGRDVALSADEQMRYGRIMTSICDGFFGDDFEERSLSAFVKEGWRKSGCAFGSFNVAANGDVYACGRVAQMKPVANIRRDDLGEVFQSLHKLTCLSRVDNLIPCKDCELRYICGGDCRVKYFSALSSLGDLRHMPEPDSLKRVCTADVKQKYYRQMVNINELLFS